MIYKCSSCQFEAPEGLPPAPRHPEYCPRCRSQSFIAVHDTERPPPPAADDGEPSEQGLRVLVSTMLYSLGKELGADGATKELYAQLEELATNRLHRPADDYLPVALTITRARKLFDVGLVVDAGGTQIAKCRSRTFSEFLRKPDFHIWLSCDDDTDCTVAALAALVEAVAGDEPAIAVAPTWLRGVATVNVGFPKVVVDRTLVGSGGRMRSCYFGGFGLVAMNKAAAQAIAHQSEQFDDDDGRQQHAAFSEIIVRHDGRTRWLGEDLSFFARVPPGVRVEALLTGHTRHDGQTLPLERVARAEVPTLEVHGEWLEAKKLNGGEREPETVVD